MSEKPPEQGGGASLDVSTFVDESVTPRPHTAEMERSLAELRVKDARWRITARPQIGWTIIGLLLVQNLAVVVGIMVAAAHREVKDLTPVIIGVTTATLVETAAIVQIVVKWLFSEIDYQAA